MSKKTFVVFGLLVVFLAVLIPWLAFRADGDSAPEASVPSNLEPAKALFDNNCGNCHTLYAAETDGNFGPDLDELLAPAGPWSGTRGTSGAARTARSAAPGGRSRGRGGSGSCAARRRRRGR